MSRCDNHGEGRFGKTFSFYPALVVDRVRYQRRLQLCQQCVDQLATVFSNQWSDRLILTRYSTESACNSCGQVRGEFGKLHPLYCVAYGRGDARHDYHASYCTDCAKSVISTLKLDESPNHDH